MLIKILIIRFSSIGDIVLTTPVMRCIKTQMENVEIHYVTKKNFVNVLQNNPYITKIHTIENSVNEVVKELQDIDFNYIIDLHKNIRSKRISRKLSRPTFMVDKLNLKKWIFTTFKINKLPDIHIVDRYLNTTYFLDVKNDNKGLDFFLSEKNKAVIKQLPAEFQKDYFTFAIGAHHATKRLPTAKIIMLCKALNHPVVLIGGETDKHVGEEVKKALGRSIYNACGKHSLHESAAIVERSKILITHDTGMMHIAAALHTKIISIWGNTSPHFGMYPYYPNDLKNKYKIIENNTLSCRPCSKIGYDKCPKQHFKCMENISVKEVLTAVTELSK